MRAVNSHNLSRSSALGRSAARLQDAFTLAELLIAIALSGIVMAAALSLASAYGYSSSQLNDLKPLRSESIALQMHIQNWLSDSDNILGIYTAPSITSNRWDEDWVEEIYTWRGDKAGTGADGIVQSDEIEVLQWVLSWDRPNHTYKGELNRYYFATENSAVVAQGDLDGTNLHNNWFDAPSMTKELWSNNVYRFSTDSSSVSGPNGPDLVCVNVALLNFARATGSDDKSPKTLYVPPKYSFQVVGTPNTFAIAEGG